MTGSKKKPNSNVKSKSSKVATASNRTTVTKISTKLNNLPSSLADRQILAASTWTKFEGAAHRIHGNGLRMSSSTYWGDLVATTSGIGKAFLISQDSPSTSADLSVAPGLGPLFLRLLSNCFVRYSIKKFKISYIPTTTSTNLSVGMIFCYLMDQKHPIFSATKDLTLPLKLEGLTNTVFSPVWQSWTRDFLVDKDTVFYTKLSSSSPTWADYRQADAGGIICVQSDANAVANTIYGRFLIETVFDFFEADPISTTVSLQLSRPPRCAILGSSEYVDGEHEDKNSDGTRRLHYEDSHNNFLKKPPANFTSVSIDAINGVTGWPALGVVPCQILDNDSNHYSTSLKVSNRCLDSNVTRLTGTSFGTSSLPIRCDYGGSNPTYQPVTLPGSPSIAISGTPNVSVTNTPAVTVSGTASVSVANTPSVSVTSLPSVSINGTVPINLSQVSGSTVSGSNPVPTSLPPNVTTDVNLVSINGVSLNQPVIPVFGTSINPLLTSEDVERGECGSSSSNSSSSSSSVRPSTKPSESITSGNVLGRSLCFSDKEWAEYQNAVALYRALASGRGF